MEGGREGDKDRGKGRGRSGKMARVGPKMIVVEINVNG